VIDTETLGFPQRSLRELPAGDYHVQALLNVYTEFPRADGHVIWAHMDQWDGQHFNWAPGNLLSPPQKVRLDSRAGLITARFGYKVGVSATCSRPGPHLRHLPSLRLRGVHHGRDGCPTGWRRAVAPSWPS